MVAEGQEPHAGTPTGEHTQRILNVETKLLGRNQIKKLIPTQLHLLKHIYDLTCALIKKKPKLLGRVILLRNLSRCFYKANGAVGLRARQNATSVCLFHFK